MTSTKSDPEGRRLRMRYAGGVVKHLGLAMYRGPVPALAELIANAWDADADNVHLEVPFGTGLKDHEITVADNGLGMSWDDVQDAYLLVGRDRRRVDGEKTPNGRKVMGRKGLGKLAGFGIARVVEVRTVHDGWLTHFLMDFDRMTNAGQAEMVKSYEPQILADETSSEASGTKISLRDLQISRSIPEPSFRDSMSRRFSVLDKGFTVYVNGKKLDPFSMEPEFRFEGDNDGWEEVTGVGSVKWWIGFTERPIRNETLRGVSVLVRDKMAQAPFFFGLSGGVHGQAGMQYMTGEVHADQLDEEKDYVSTDRQGVLWTEPMPAALLEWGQQKIRDTLSRWVKRRNEANEDRLSRIVSEAGGASVESRMSRLTPREQSEARRVIKQLSTIESVTDDPDRARDLVDLVLRAFEDSSFFALLRALKDTDKAESDEVLRLVTELDVFETVKMA